MQTAKTQPTVNLEKNLVFIDLFLPQNIYLIDQLEREKKISPVSVSAVKLGLPENPKAYAP